MKLIIDSGATKADWCLVEGGQVVRRFKTAGMNVSVLTPEAVAAIASEASAGLEGPAVSEAYLYAAGLIEGSDAAALAVEAV